MKAHAQHGKEVDFMIRRWLWVVLAAGGFLALATPESQAEKLPQSVLASGGGSASGANQRLQATIGQTAIGMSSSSASMLCAGFWCTPGSRVVAVEEPPGTNPLPLRLELGPPRPNPAPGAVAFTLALPTAARVRLLVYDVRGRLVAKVADETLPAGWHNLSWTPGRSSHGVGAGVYFAKAFVGGELLARRRIVVLP